MNTLGRWVGVGWSRARVSVKVGLFKMAMLASAVVSPTPRTGACGTPAGSTGTPLLRVRVGVSARAY